ncbi:MAG: BRCT domain-containing protein [Promethearchaeota archaeon]
MFVLFLNSKKITIKTKQEGGIFNGKSICITGKLNNITRNEAKNLVISLGGAFKSSVTKNLSFLVTNNPNSGSSKNMKAKQLGIEIINEQQFLELAKG